MGGGGTRPLHVVVLQTGQGPAQMHVWLQENSQGLIVGLYGWLTVSFLVTALVLLTIMRQKRHSRHW